MKKIGGLILGAVLLVAFVTASGAIYIVPEGLQAIITEFGKPIGDAVTSAGIHIKVPFIQEVRYLDKRILIWDGDKDQIPTKDKKYIWVDTTARWRITDPLLFIQRVQNERGARLKLNDIIDSSTRDVISGNNLVEAVRNTNVLLEKVAENREKAKSEKSEDSDLIGEIEKIEIGREQLSQKILKESNKELSGLGIEVIDVQLRRISYEPSVLKKVYDRMISERQRVAEKIRSIGKGEKAKIQGRLGRDLQQIQATAYRKSQRIRGKAEALATSIYAKAFTKDPKFYEFVRTLEAYEKSLSADSEFILSSESQFLQLFKRGRVN